MKKLMIAALTMSAMVAFGGEFIDFGGASSYESVDGAFRVKLGGFGRGGIKTSIEGFGVERGEAYGADLDLEINTWSAENFNLWAGIGGAFAPNQNLVKASYYEVEDYGFMKSESFGSSKINCGYGELRLLLEPEYKVTERWAVGLRAGVAFDWVRVKAKDTTLDITTTQLTPPEIDIDGPYSMSMSDSSFVAQGIIGLQTSYMFCDNLGIYGAIDYRGGNDVKLKCEGEEYAKVNLDGWYWGVGLIYQF